MPFTVVVALAKLGIFGATHRGLTPALAALILPSVLKFAFGFRHVREAFMNMLYSIRVFFFQMGQLTHSEDPNSGGNGAGNRWQRAVRLVYERLSHARDAESTAAVEEHFYDILMFSL